MKNIIFIIDEDYIKELRNLKILVDLSPFLLEEELNEIEDLFEANKWLNSIILKVIWGKIDGYANDLYDNIEMMEEEETEALISLYDYLNIKDTIIEVLQYLD